MPELAMAELTGEEWTRLLQAERRSLVGFLTMLTGDRHAADDLFQEVCLESWHARSTFESGTNFGAWLRGVARIQLLRHWQREKKYRFVTVNPEILEQLAESWSGEADDRPREAALADCVKELEAQHAQVLRWRYSESWPHSRIARETGKSEDAVKMLLFRVRKILETCVDSKMRENA
jgi:RNA polymerase sigma-70 factor (ECF subfamily)